MASGNTRQNLELQGCLRAPEREVIMSRIELLYPTRKGREADDLENNLRHLVVGQDEAIRVVRAYQTYLAGMSPATMRAHPL
jgi:hypothetical protein